MANYFAFIAEWFQEEAEVIRKFLIKYYPDEQSIEIFYYQTTKAFLRKTRMADLHQRDFFIGSKLSIFGRQIQIVGYGNESTKKALGLQRQKVFILVTHSCNQLIGKILSALVQSGFQLNNALMVRLSEEGSRQIFGHKHITIEISALINKMSVGPMIGLDMVADNAIDKLITSFSPSSANEKNKILDNKSLMTLFEDEVIRGAFYFSKTEEETEYQLSNFFDPVTNLYNTAVLVSSTLVLIKPHAIKEGKVGEIITDISNNGFQITAVKTVVLEKVNCQEFYEIYRGVLHEYNQMVTELASGICLALEIVCNDSNKNSHQTFRELCGPMDTEIAKSLRPNTLRAKYGTNKILNALHCTDLADDAILETEYFFKILD